MIKVMIVDDEPLAIAVIKSYLEQHPGYKVIAECQNGFEAVKAINREQPDLIFLDIQMPKISGLELLELLEPAPPVIFITAFQEHAVEAFEKHAIDYLLKPVSRERFDAALLKFRNSSASTHLSIGDLYKDVHERMDRIVVRDGSNLRIIPLNEIFYFEASDDYVKICLEKESVLKKQTLTSLEERIDSSDFVRVHRSYILNISKIVRVEPLGKETHIAILKNNAKVQLSRSGFARLKQSLRI